MMQVIQKAQAGANLTPGERALLKVISSLFVNGITTGLLAAGSYLMAPGMIDVQNLIYIIIIALVFSVAHGVAKYITAQGDPALGTAIEVVTQAAEKRVPLPAQNTPGLRIPRFTSMPTMPEIPVVQPPPQPPQRL